MRAMSLACWPREGRLETFDEYMVQGWIAAGFERCLALAGTLAMSPACWPRRGRLDTLNEGLLQEVMAADVGGYLALVHTSAMTPAYHARREPLSKSGQNLVHQVVAAGTEVGIGGMVFWLTMASRSLEWDLAPMLYTRDNCRGDVEYDCRLLSHNHTLAQ